jgi:hypothetical protein
VVISVDTAWREAQAAGLTLEERLVQLVVHGLLHLCGYDHEHDAADARRMAAKSRQLLNTLNAAGRAEPARAAAGARGRRPRVRPDEVDGRDGRCGRRHRGR